MTTLFPVLAVIALTLLLVFWAIEFIKGFSRTSPRDLLDTLESNCVEEMMCELDEVGEAGLTREEIWQRMAWIWGEIRVLAHSLSPGWSYVLLFHCWLFYGVLWVKTLIWPHGGDLRLLLGAELFVLCQVKRSR